MKCDGHVKITNQALAKLQESCRQDASLQRRICQIGPLRARQNLVRPAADWSPEESSSNDNTSVAVAHYIDKLVAAASWLLPPATRIVSGWADARNASLLRTVVGIDIDPSSLPKHYLSAHQRIHFMRAQEETSASGCHRACAFILENTNVWVKAANRHFSHPLLDMEGDNDFPPSGVEALGLALHCLQDSFSPGHVTRGPRQANGKPGRIKAVEVYDEANQHHHSGHDYESGATLSVAGKDAVEASVALLRLAVQSASAQRDSLQGWIPFRDAWLNS